MKDVVLAFDATGKIIGKFVNPSVRTVGNNRAWPANSKRMQLWNLQNGLCHLCGGLMLQETSKHPDSATFDHLIPRSKGGSMAMHNIRLAHYRCNQQRGNASLDQPR